ncbi:UNVERIFIED_CONTAM: hypothetical protein Cloal_4002 [Acetivibrio alkalicellulosi]
MFKINKQQIKISVSLVMLFCSIFAIINHFQNIGMKEEYKVAFMTFAIVSPEENNYVEIFDIDKGQVIKQLPANQITYNESIEYLKTITGMYPKVSAIPDKGYIIKIPLQPSLAVKNQWLDDILSEIYIVFPKEDTSPYLLVLDHKKRPLFYSFNANTDTLLKNLDFEIHP